MGRVEMDLQVFEDESRRKRQDSNQYQGKDLPVLAHSYQNSDLLGAPEGH